uniref:Peptidase S1 domain-containing protein n=1 Tax=Salvator merianae TaxID=96440 RepID=A0A8D0C155_SALMN
RSGEKKFRTFSVLALVCNFMIVLSFAECGTRFLLNETTGNRIVGGHDAPFGAWPWQVSLQVYVVGIGYHHLCGGALLTNSSVLTAAHCVKGWENPAFWRIVIGMHQLNNYNSHVIRRRVRAITIHANYSPDTFENDLAMFTVSKYIRFNDYVQPICLPVDDALLYKKDPCYISGWGVHIYICGGFAWKFKYFGKLWKLKYMKL